MTDKPTEDLTPEFLEQIAGDLDAAQRHGNDRDAPEGARYAILSDTLLTRLAGDLLGCAMKWREDKNRSVEQVAVEITGTPPSGEYNWREGGQR